MRKILLLSIIATAFCLLTNAKAQPHYSITDLGSLEATSINNSKQITGSVAGVAVIYFNGTIKSLGTLGQTYSFGYDINQHSQVTGFAYTPEGETHAFLYSGGLMKDLGLGSGVSINNKAVVVGNIVISSTQYRAAISYNGGPLQVLANYNPSQNSTATGINDSNRVVGYEGVGNPKLGFLWQNGKILYLPSEDGLGGGVGPQAINKFGHITGEIESSYGSNQWHTFLYRDGKITVFVGKGEFTDGASININDQIVGYDGPMRDGYNRAALFMNGQTYDLNNLVLPADSSRLITGANSINDSGQILANGFKFPNGIREYHTFLLTPRQ